MICKNKTLVSKQRDREVYWGVSRWHGRAKILFFVGLLIDVIYFAFLCLVTGALFRDPYAKQEVGYILLCTACWILFAFFVLHVVFQGHIFANKAEKIRRKMKGHTPVYAETEFYTDYFVFKSAVYDEIEQVSYSNIVKYKETANYCVLITASGSVYAYGKEEFEQGSAAEAYALISEYLNKK